MKSLEGSTFDADSQKGAFRDRKGYSIREIERRWFPASCIGRAGWPIRRELDAAQAATAQLAKELEEPPVSIGARSHL
jgi:hypothetical protein